MPKMIGEARWPRCQSGGCDRPLWTPVGWLIGHCRRCMNDAAEQAGT